MKTLERPYVVCSTEGRRFDSSRRNAFYLRKRHLWFAQDTWGAWDLDEVVGLGEGLACREALALAFLHT